MNITPTQIAAVVSLCAVGAGLSYLRNRARLRRRRDEVGALAAELGWGFSPDRNSFHDNEFPQLRVFRRGSFRAAYNTIDGRLNIGGRRLHCRMGDYSYHDSSGGDRGPREVRFSYLLVHLPAGSLPALHIRPERRLDRLKDALGLADVRLGSEEFDRRFRVTCPDPGFAAEVLSSPTMQWLLAVDPPAIDIDAGVMCLTDGSLWSPETFRLRMAFAAQFLDRWPGRLLGGPAAMAG